jgi:hypothetical protein
VARLREYQEYAAKSNMALAGRNSSLQEDYPEVIGRSVADWIRETAR